VRLELQFFYQRRSGFLGRAAEHLRGFLLCAAGRFCSSTTTGRSPRTSSEASQLAHFFGLGALDAHQSGVAELVAAGLDGEDGGRGQLDGLEPAFFELALHREAGVGFFDVEDERGMGQAEELGDDDAGLAQAEIFRLQAGEQEVGASRALTAAASRRATERASRVARSSQRMWMARSAPLARASRMTVPDALGAGREHDDFAAVLLLELKRFFEGVGVGLVQRVLQVRLFNPFAGGVDADLRSRSGTCLMATMIFMLKDSR
jgi:hypothetical protein